MKYEDNFKKHLDDMYQLGKKHGFELGQKDMELKLLNEEIKRLEDENKGLEGVK